jgi:hypothetical protein
MPYDFEADAQLLRDVLSTAAHDLGGLSSALSLRADVLTGTLPAADEGAIRAVADEMRSLGRQLRVLRGPQGGETLAPAAGRSFAEWFSLAERFGRPVLGRGGALRGTIDDGAFDPTHETERAYALLLAVLACCRAARARRGTRTVDLHLRVHREPSAVVVTMRLAWGDGREGDEPAEVRRWLAHAQEVATAAGLSWDGSEGGDSIVLRAPG